MLLKTIFVALVLLSLTTLPLQAQQSLDALVDKELPSLLDTYKMLHTQPELSHREAKTSAFLAAQLKALGFVVTEHVGKYENQAWTGYGVAAVMKNGPGPTILVRTDMDALP